MSVLLQHRATFLNQVTAMQYIGYAHNKLHAFAKEHINKDLYHALRLASEADRIVNKKFPMVQKRLCWHLYFPKVFMEGPLREELMAIRIGEVNTSEVVARISALLCNAEAKVSSLPQKIDENILNVWLLSIYGISPQVQALQQYIIFYTSNNILERLTRLHYMLVAYYKNMGLMEKLFIVVSLVVLRSI